jgi:MerR family transcriptional regulator, thiopeptide resistance regulator
MLSEQGTGDREQRTGNREQTTENGEQRAAAGGDDGWGAMSGSYRIGEFAKLAGVTVRALHHYDRIGLLKPQRGSSGFRVYDLKDMERLEQIAALKFLGIPLAEIKLLLKRGPLTLADSLHMQREALAEKRRLIDRAVVAIEAAEKVIQAGQKQAGQTQAGKTQAGQIREGRARAGQARAEPITDAAILRRIIEVIDMQPQENFMRKYYSDQAWLEKERIMRETPAEEYKKRGLALRQVFAEIEADVDRDPASEDAQALTKRWLREAEAAHGGNEAVRAGNIEAWNDFKNWPPDQQDNVLAAFGLDLQDRATSLRRYESVTKFLGRTIGYKIRSNMPSVRSLYGLDQA